MYVTLVHPAKAVGRNEVPFGMDTYVVSSNMDIVITTTTIN